MSSKQKSFRLIGLIGVVIAIWLFVRTPSFPTPDKLLVFLLLVFMALGQGLALLKRLLPFVLILLAYESFRSVADQLNTHVNYGLAPHFDNLVFRNLPTIYLQNWLWHGHVSWYDYVFYLAYMLHFVLPLGLAILVWKLREAEYWRLVSTFLAVAFASFATFFLFPAAPPWLAADQHYIQPVIRISSDVWAGLGLKNFPSFYNHISANPVAAIPSLHAAWATLVLVFVYKYFGRRWAALAAVYPFLIFVGTVYEGEHYFFDLMTGVAYGLAGYFATPWLIKSLKQVWLRLRSRFATVFE